MFYRGSSRWGVVLSWHLLSPGTVVRVLLPCSPKMSQACLYIPRRTDVFFPPEILNLRKRVVSSFPVLWTREYFLFHSLLPSCNCSVLMAWALLNVGVSSCSHRLALCTSGCLLMALGAEPTTVDPFHFLLCLACPFSSAKWAWSTRFPSLTVKRKTPAPSFCGRSRSLAAGLQSVCSTPSFRKAFCSKSAVDFNLSR